MVGQGPEEVGGEEDPNVGLGFVGKCRMTLAARVEGAWEAGADCGQLARRFGGLWRAAGCQALPGVRVCSISGEAGGAGMGISSRMRRGVVVLRLLALGGAVSGAGAS